MESPSTVLKGPVRELTALLACLRNTKHKRLVSSPMPPKSLRTARSLQVQGFSLDILTGYCGVCDSDLRSVNCCMTFCLCLRCACHNILVVFAETRLVLDSDECSLALFGRSPWQSDWSSAHMTARKPCLVEEHFVPVSSICVLKIYDVLARGRTW